jgi:hypothetical protein
MTSKMENFYQTYRGQICGQIHGKKEMEEINLWGSRAITTTQI